MEGSSAPLFLRGRYGVTFLQPVGGAAGRERHRDRITGRSRRIGRWWRTIVAVRNCSTARTADGRALRSTLRINRRGDWGCLAPGTASSRAHQHGDCSQYSVGSSHGIVSPLRDAPLERSACARGRDPLWMGSWVGNRRTDNYPLNHCPQC